MNDNSNPKNNISRRDFLKTMGVAGLATAGLASCKGDKGVGEVDPSGSELPIGKMTYRTNPNTGDKVSLLAFGMMRLPTKSVGEDKDEEIDQEEVNRLVDYAIEHGVNYFDTSPAYCRGLSERSTGIALSRHPREKYFVATKLSNFSPSQWKREESIAMYHRSLKELQVDYIDYMLLHGVGGGGVENFENRYVNNGVLDYLVEERKAGRVRNLGFSYHGDKEVFDHLLALHDKYHWDFVMIQMNYVDWKFARDVPAEYLYEELAKRNIPVLIMEPLLGGRLFKLPNYIMARMKQREPERSVASWAFRFCGTYPGVLTVLSGMNRMEHLQDNLRSYAPLKPLDAAELDFLQEMAVETRKFKTIPCNDCKYCMPCPYGIDIPAILLHYNKCVNEGSMTTSVNDENYRKARQTYLVGYDRSVPKLRQANHCIGCGQCNEHCPQRINIPRELRRIDEYVEKLKQNTL